MNRTRCRARSAALCMLLFMAISGCVDLDKVSPADNRPVTSTSAAESTVPNAKKPHYQTDQAALNYTAKFRLTAEVVPGGHVSSSNHFVLSGTADPGLTKTTSASPHFRLTGRPMITDP